MKNKLKLLSLLVFSSLSITGCYVDLGFIKIGQKDDQNSTDDFYDEEAQNAHILEYYSSIDSSSSGTALLSSLYSLNMKKRTKQVGYNNMGSNASGMFKYTDYDPATAKRNSSGVPYGTKILSFYSGKSVTTFDREHVWPASRLTGGREGNVVDDDIFMPRPTASEENQARGNSVYVTGMDSSSAGWDPVTVFSSTLGVYEGIRGECARIVFYCMTCDDSLVLNDNTSNSGNNMGKITNLIEWACENPVNSREKRRNVGGEYLQGNRNAFVDHPEYACKIWGNTNSATRSACQKANYPVK